MSKMDTGAFLCDALVTSPVETMEWVELCFLHSCELVTKDVCSAIGTLQLARASAVAQCRALVDPTVKLIAALHERLRNVAANLDAVTNLCTSAMVLEDARGVKAAVEEGRRGWQLSLDLQAATAVWFTYWAVQGLDMSLGLGSFGDGGVFEQLVHVPTFNDCAFVFKIDKGKPAACLPRGQHSFTLHVDVSTRTKSGWSFEGEVDKLQASGSLQLRPEHVAVSVYGDGSATYTCAQHSDKCGVVVAYAAAFKPAHVQIIARVLGVQVCNQRLVTPISLISYEMAACTKACLPCLSVCRSLANVPQKEFSGARSCRL